MREHLPRNQRGFSLPELLLIIAIIGILAVVTIPNFNAFLKSYRCSTAVGKMVNAINLGRQLSVTRREAHTFTPVADPTNTWSLTNDVTSEVVMSGELPEGVDNTVAAAFTFDSKGACTTPTTYTGTTPTGQFVRVEGVIHSTRLDRFTLELSPAGRVKSSLVHVP